MVIFVWLLLAKTRAMRNYLGEYFGFLVLCLSWFILDEAFKTPKDLFNLVRVSIVPALEGYFFFAWIPLNGTHERAKPVVLLCKLMLIGNFLSVLFFPHGVFVSSRNSSKDRVQWLFGSKNNISIYLIFCLAIVIISLYVLNEKKGRALAKFIFYSFISFFPAVMCGEFGIGLMSGSSSGIVGVGLLIGMGFYLVFVPNKKNRVLANLIRPKVLLAVTLLFYVFILFSSLPLINYFVTQILGKELTFSNRVGGWQSAIYQIRKSLLFGYGERDIWLVLSNGKITTYVYNSLLKVTLNYGIVGLALFILLIMNTSANRKRVLIVDSVIALGVCGVLVVGMMNEVNYFFFTAFGGIAFYLSRYTQFFAEEPNDINSLQS